MKFLKLAVEGVVTGLLSGAAVSVLWQVAFGRWPSLLELLAAGEAATTVWSLWQAARFRRKWLAVLDAYRRPALGEGIDIPHRPPADEQ
ncbi:hypothetical protein OG762_36610 [Streptomyces sp. NBC_01136]|uniref:hypothetical protein n=1 Tax=Streptomyces sp. NBC_01136 TaxID=2903754 RepID=UPI0038673053|nr:hypothetical protein OG762_36610 [Streptomyces sp. NBC_01136]